ncbi:MAG: 5-(carboxyamino)imidazole ribonucleotide synthase [Pseudomonadota bacterium]
MTAGAAGAGRIVPPGGVVGVLGGGQLGRMLALAAARLGLRAAVYAAPGDAPAAEVAGWFVSGAPDYLEGMADFAARCDVVTFEFENVPAAALAAAGAHAPLRPGPRSLEICQDRLSEKLFVEALGFDVAPYAPVDGIADLVAALDAFGGGGILKTRRLGYDGRGQVRIAPDLPDREAAAAAAWTAIGGAPAILEAVAPFLRELSVVAARGADGELRAYDATETEHESGVLRRSLTPGAIAPETAARAAEIARAIATGLEHVGVLAVEMFELPEGRLLVNEIAPRVHNSGHWTQNACAVDQFEQHMRAVCGWPLGDPARHSDAVMRNLLGDEAEAWRALAETPGLALHLYGKAEARPGRKMGHVTMLAPRCD